MRNGTIEHDTRMGFSSLAGFEARFRWVKHDELMMGHMALECLGMNA